MSTKRLKKKPSRPSIAWVAAGLIAIAAPSHVSVGAEQKLPDLEAGFKSPPNIARPGAYWMWINGNVSKEGIDFDLRSMKAAGMAGGTIFNIGDAAPSEFERLLGKAEQPLGVHGFGVPPGPAEFFSPEWFELVDYAAQRALELGLELGMHNSPGYIGGGGPWITPEYAQRALVWSETSATGPKRIELQLPPATAGLTRSAQLPGDTTYRDVAVLAFPRAKVRPCAADAAAYPEDLFPHAMFGGKPKLARMVPADAVIDLTDKLDAGGKLVWEVPEGEWIVMRFGHQATGNVNVPPPRGGLGLMVDHYSREAVEFHWQRGIQPVLDRLGGKVGKSFTFLAFDSIEGHDASWTGKMAEEFSKRRGYSPVRWLPVFAGTAIGSLDASRRFLADFNATRSDLWEQNFAGVMRERCHERGMTLHGEVYGTKNFRSLGYGGAVDAPMSEFWSNTSPGDRVSFASPRPKVASSAAHIYGKRLVPAEAFTAPGEFWKADPRTLKAKADANFICGVNKLIFHAWPHQAWGERYLPGMTFGRWGTVFAGTLTWWPQARSWIDYLGRTQWMLQEGGSVADVACLHDVETETTSGGPGGEAFDKEGYRSDLVDRPALFQMRVEEGGLTLPAGPRYAILWLPPRPKAKNWKADAELVARVRELVEAGAKVVGDAPAYVPRLVEDEAAIAAARKSLAEMWPAPESGKKRTSLGQGCVFQGYRPEEALAELGVRPDLQTASLGWIHRRSTGADWYFLANLGLKPVAENVSFRISGRRPELWNPQTGEIGYPALWCEKEGRTELTVDLPPLESAFIVFREPSQGLDPLKKLDGPRLQARSAEGPLRMARDGDIVLEAGESGSYTYATASGKSGKLEIAVPPEMAVDGPWELQFQPGRGGPGKPVVFKKLSDWTANDDPAIRYFSGWVDYSKSVDIPADRIGDGKRLLLDLGDLNNLAEIAANGKNLGVLWKEPWIIDATDALVAGKNKIRIRVVNTWVNRVIGDEQKPDSIPWAKEMNPPAQFKRDTFHLKAWPEWLRAGDACPDGRLTVYPWKYWTKDDPLLPSGLLGPVTIHSTGVEHLFRRQN